MNRLLTATVLSLFLFVSMAFAQNPWQKNSTALQTPQFAKAAVAQTKVPNLQKRVRHASKKNLNAPAAKLKIASIYASADPTKTVVKLVVDTVWMDGSGYQILLDSKHEINEFYDPDYGLDQENIQDLYDAADIKIPANATPDWLDAHAVMDGHQDSAIIEPGIYDLFILNPSEDYWTGENHVYIASGDAARLDDFKFLAGYTYVFTAVMDGDYDNILFSPPFDLVLSKLMLPVSGCELEDLDIKIEIANNGTEDYTEEYTVFYTIAETADTVKEKISEPLAAGESTTYTFLAPATIEANKVAQIYAGIIPGDREGLFENNYASRLVLKHDPVSIPHNIDIANYEMMPVDADYWYIDSTGIAAAYAPNIPLISVCFDMEAGETYRFSYDYTVGFDLFGLIQIPGSYSIGFGPTSQDWNEWETILLDTNIIQLDFITHEVIVTPEEAGTYAFYIMEEPADGNGTLQLRNISISKVIEYDVRLNAFVSDLPRIMPVEHVNQKFAADVTVENRGTEKIDKATVSISLEDREIGTKEITLGEIGAVKTESVDFTLSGLKVNDKVEITTKVVIDGHESDDINPDNEIIKDLEVSQDIMAYDYVTEDMYTEDYAIGASASIGCGLPFSIASKDTLTAVSIGWAELEEDIEIKITIHRWNAKTQTLGDLILENTTRRGKEAGQRTYDLPAALLLEPGDYIISAVQTGSTFYGLIADGTEEGYLYVTTATPANLQYGLGFPAIRAVFGQNGKPMAKDISVQQILKPGKEGLFSANEPIVVSLVNRGYEAVTVPMNVMIDKTLLGSKNVEIKGYGQAEVSFTADLSAPDTEFLITAFASLTDDEDRSNDTCSKTVYSLPPADPYTMDFEYTEDFAITGFNPAWTTVDVDEAPIYGFTGLTFPHDGEAFAFIAFNPLQTTPAASGVTLESLTPHGGNRFGASFCSSAGVNDDWLISPKLTLPASHAELRFFVKSYISNYGLEKFNVLVSGTDNKPESFTALGETREAPEEEWEEIVIDLSDYAGKAVHLAIQCVSEDAFVFMIDDIRVSKPAGIEGDRLSAQLKLYPNPVKEAIAILSSDAAIRQVSIFSLSGSLMYQSADNLNTESFRYSVQDLTSGIYFARVRTEQGTAVLKFIVR